jgi:hypothetical protein
VETRAEGDGALVGVNLDITEDLVVVGGNDDVDGLDDTGEVLVQVLLGDLELEKSTVDLVDDDDGLDTLTKGLAQHSLGLDADTFYGINDDKGAVGDTESGGDLGREINVTGRVDQVDQEVVLLDLDGDVLEVLLVDELRVQRDGRGLDRHTALLLVCSRIRKPSFSGFRRRDDTGALDEGVGEGGLSVIDCKLCQSCVRVVRGSRRDHVPWAMTDMLRMFSALSISSRICCRRQYGPSAMIPQRHVLPRAPGARYIPPLP